MRLPYVIFHCNTAALRVAAVALGFYRKHVPIPPERISAAYFFQPVFLKGVGEYFFLFRSMVYDLAQGVDDHGIAAMINTIPVISNAVHSYRVRLVLDGP